MTDGRLFMKNGRVLWDLLGEPPAASKRATGKTMVLDKELSGSRLRTFFAIRRRTRFGCSDDADAGGVMEAFPNPPIETIEARRENRKSRQILSSLGTSLSTPRYSNLLQNSSQST